MSARDEIIDIIGNIGKWQWFIVLPLAFRDIFTSWQMLAQPFLTLVPQNYYCAENGYQNFATLHEWQNFANPKDSDGNIDKCSVYDLSYSDPDLSIRLRNGGETTNSTRKCENWIFPDNEPETLVTEVSCAVDF